MSASQTVVATRPGNFLLVRDGRPADYPAIREVVLAAYGQYASLIPQDVFEPYLEDLLDLEKHAHNGQWLVVEADGQILGSGAFYPDATVQGVGWPPGWASGRGLAVRPATRGRGVARALLAASERLAGDGGAPIFAFHTASFMTGAIALYEQFGYLRAPDFDYNMAAQYNPSAAPITSIAYVRRLNVTSRPRRIR